MNAQKQLFFRQFRQRFVETGAVLPSSKFLGRAMCAYLAQKQGPVRVLEAGAGTGVFTEIIVSLLQPGDTFDVVEINPELFACLEQKFGAQSGLGQRGITVNLIQGDLRTVALGEYDYIVFSLPLTNFPSQLIQELLERMVTCLKPGGVFSYVKYIFISRFKYVFGGSAVRAGMRANQAVIDAFTHRYQFDRRAVLRNVPPAWVYYWRKAR